MVKNILVVIFLLMQLSCFAQDSDYTICDCCTYTFFQYKNDYDNVFPPDKIKANGIKELTIYTRSKKSQNLKDTSFKVVDTEYREMIFVFNSDGYVLSQTLFNRRGRYHSIYEFTRDNNNRILTNTFHYLDDAGNKMNDFIPEKWIYDYSDNHIIKVKKLGDNFSEQPDNKSDYNIYVYDSKGRVLSETRQLYFDGTEPAYYQSITKYNDTTNTSITTTRNKKHLFSIVKTKYAEDQQALNRKFYDGQNNKLLQEEIFTYDSKKQLIRYQAKNSGMGTECPDGGNFVNLISYSSKNIIDKILHQYKNTVCELRFVYK